MKRVLLNEAAEVTRLGNVRFAVGVICMKHGIVHSRSDIPKSTKGVRSL